MNQKFNGVLFTPFNILLVLALLSGCAVAGTVSETATPPAGETSAAQSNESCTPDPTAGSGTEHPVPQELKIIPEAYYQPADQQGTLTDLYYDTYADVDDNGTGNFAFRVKEGYSHDGTAAMEYTYNGLVWFWK